MLIAIVDLPTRVGSGLNFSGLGGARVLAFRLWLFGLLKSKIRLEAF
jgi:hypothetical protein